MIKIYKTKIKGKTPNKHIREELRKKYRIYDENQIPGRIEGKDVFFSPNYKTLKEIAKKINYRVFEGIIKSHKEVVYKKPFDNATFMNTLVIVKNLNFLERFILNSGLIFLNEPPKVEILR